VGWSVVPHREVAVVGGHDRISHGGLVLGAAPLADARAARIGEYGGIDVAEGLHLPIPLDRRPDLLGARRRKKGDGSLESMGLRLLGNVGRAAHVFI